MKHRIGVIGVGAWGTTIAKVLVDNGHSALIWAHNEDSAHQISVCHTLSFLPGVRLPDALSATTNLSEVMNGAQELIFAIASNFVDFVDQLLPLYRNQPILVLTKGLLENKPTIFLMEYLQSKLGPNAPIAILSGPNLALEIAQEKYCASTIASVKIETANLFQTLISNDYFRTYTSTDVIGVSLGGILKNTLAIAAGISDGLGLGQNAKSALMTRGLQEMIRIGRYYGANPETFFGLSGLGDLITTCCSEKSRNWQTGYAIAKGETAAEVACRINAVAEGVKTAKLVFQTFKDSELDIPIFREVYAVLYDQKDPQLAIQHLMTRQLKSE